MAADIAIEISKVAVEALVNKVRSAMAEEAEQWQTVQRDLVFIVDELEMMQSFLGSADREAVKTSMERTWVRQVRELSHDLEDCIEFIRHLDTDKRRWWLRLRPSCNCGRDEAALPVDEAVTKIKQLKARVEEVSQRNRRYMFVSAVPKFPTPPQDAAVPGAATGTRGFDILVEARDTAARYRSVGDLTRLVMGESNDIQVISVWGTGDDLGTTSIIRSMYDAPEVQERFRSRAWVKVMHPINIPELIRSLVVQFYANSWQQEQDEATAGTHAPLSWLYRLKKRRDAMSWTETSAGDLVKELVRQINNTQRYLVVLEDLSAMDQWDAIRPYLLRVRGEKKNGSRIVVSTRHHEIASLCTGNPYRVSELRRLSASQSICVFFNTGLQYTKGGVTKVTGIVPTIEVEEKSKNIGLVGRDAEIQKVFNLIKCNPHASKPHVVCVWGLPGSGRTAVVTNVCNKMAEDFHYTRTLDMSQPYNLMGFSRCLLSDILVSPSSLEGETPIEKCRDLLHKFRCLVIIDEVKSREEWKEIEDAHLISSNSKSCFVIITTEEIVAVQCAGAEDLVCEIKCLQPQAAFVLFQQAFQDQYQNIRNTPKKQEFQGDGNFLEQTLEFIFETGTLKQPAFQNSGNSSEGEAFQNNGNSFKEAFQNNGKMTDGEASQNTGSLMDERTFQNNGNLIDGETSENSRNLMEEPTFQNNENLIYREASQNSDDILEEQTYQNNGNLIDREAFKNNGNSLRKQTLQNNVRPLEEDAIQNNGKSFEEQVLDNNGNSFQEQPAFQNNGYYFLELAFQNNSVDLLNRESSQNDGHLFEGKIFQEGFGLFEVNKQDEYGFQNKGSSSAEPAMENSVHFFDEHEIRKSEICDKRAFENSGKLFEDVESENCESSSEEESVQHCGNLIEELKTLRNGTLLEEHKMEDPLDEQAYLNNLVDSFQKDPNVKAILSKSGGFPQVIVALGRYMARQHVPNKNIGATEWQCQRLITNFMLELQTNPQFYCLGGLLAWMRSHFSSCPPSLMRCMLYLLIFPRGQAFGRKRLVRRWVAEGYANNTESHSILDEEYAGELLDKLASQSVIMNVMQQEARYEVNGFFHEYMVSRPMEDRILSPLEVSVLHDRHGRVTPQGVGQHVSVWSNWERKNRVVFDSLDLSRLRSFTVFGPWEPFFVSDKMAVLRVLDLEDSTGVTDGDVDRIGKVLLRLKFLSLRGCKDITRLPDSLGGLSQLQTLDIRGTSVDKIGPCITKLPKLQYVRARRQLDEDTSTVDRALLQPKPPAETSSATAAPAPPSSTSRPTGTALLMSRLRLAQWMTRHRRRPLLPGPHTGGVRMHGGNWKMTALHTLGVIDVSDPSGRSILVELGKLSQIRKLGVSGVKRESVHPFCSAIACHSTHLESLSVWFDKGMNRAGCLDTISPPPLKLKSLKLYGHPDKKLPSWIKRSLLSKLALQMTTIPQKEIDEVLADLPKLITLFLCFQEFENGSLQFRRGGFRALQLLDVALNNGLKEVTFHSGAMNNLEVLRLRCRDDVHMPPSFCIRPNSLGNLDEVKLTGSRYCHDALKQLLKSELQVLRRIRGPVVTVDSPEC